MKIAVISDSHGFLPAPIKTFISETDEIWHAGDIGSLELLEDLRKIKPTIAVFGNIDGREVRLETCASSIFSREGKKIFIQHIVGYPGNYEKSILPYLEVQKPDIVIAGHSHILRVIFDQKQNWLYINPAPVECQDFIKKSLQFALILTPKEFQIFEIFEVDRH